MSLPYRREIDGLRAISVVGVIVYHATFEVAGWRILPGGFLGVDVFFVISGYLITSILLADIAADRFSFAQFYERRARRILPAYFVVLAASAPFAWMWMFPAALSSYSGSALSSLVFGSNFWFWSEDSYTAEPSALKPLLHTWSLAIEEQFYLLFPIAMLGLRRLRPVAIVLALGGVALASLAFAQWASEAQPNAAFFLLPSRAWELLAGALLAAAERFRGRTPRRAWPASLGLGLIVLSFVVFDDGMRHPSLWTALPVAGAMLVVWFGGGRDPGGRDLGERDIGGRLLASAPFVGVGIISYSLYLWHAPIFAFARIRLDVFDDAAKIAALVLTVALSLATYAAVERPARSRAKVGARPLFAGLAAATVLVGASQAAVHRSGGAPERLAWIAHRLDVAYWGPDKPQYRDYATHYGCWIWKENAGYDAADPFRSCRKKERLSPTGRILVIGDSHAAMLVPGLIASFGAENVVQRTASTCLPSQAYYDARPGTRFDYCRGAVRQAFAAIRETDPDLIVVGADWDHKNVERLLGRDLPRELGDRAADVVVFGPAVQWENDLRGDLFAAFVRSGAFPERLAPDPSTFALDVTARRVATSQGFGYVSPPEAFCDGATCVTRVSDRPDGVLSWDRSHFSQAASRALIAEAADELRAQLEDRKPLGAP